MGARFFIPKNACAVQVELVYEIQMHCMDLNYTNFSNSSMT